MKTVRYQIPKHNFFVVVLPLIRQVQNIIPPDGEDFPQFQIEDKDKTILAERHDVWKFDIDEINNGLADSFCKSHTGLNGPDLLQKLRQDREKEMKKAKQIGFFLFKEVSND